MRLLRIVLAAGVAAGISSAASAGVVTEVEPNDSFATAQSLDGQFSLGSDPNVANASTVPYVSVVSGTPSGSYDYYSFTVGAGGSTALFDIDFGMNDFDPYLSLFDSAFNLIASHDDGGVLDPGSVDEWDPYFSYNFASGGLYYVRVGTCCVSPGTADYQLNVSLANPGTPGAVPEPATWAMMLMGFGATGFAMRRRRQSVLATA